MKEAFLLGLGTFALLGVYFLLALNAYGREHHNKGAILLLNLVLGWTILGWVAALIWSATSVQAPSTELIVSNDKEGGEAKQCPYCAESIKKAAKICRYCGKELDLQQ